MNENENANFNVQSKTDREGGIIKEEGIIN